jgi:hypothetical protein
MNIDFFSKFSQKISRDLDDFSHLNVLIVKGISEEKLHL